MQRFPSVLEGIDTPQKWPAGHWCQSVQSVRYSRNLTESVTVVLEEGAVPGPDHLTLTLMFANPNIVRALAIAAGVMINARASAGCVLFIILLSSFPLMHIIEFVVFDTQCSYHSHCYYRNVF